MRYSKCKPNSQKAVGEKQKAVLDAKAVTAFSVLPTAFYCPVLLDGSPSTGYLFALIFMD